MPGVASASWRSSIPCPRDSSSSAASVRRGDDHRIDLDSRGRARDEPDPQRPGLDPELLDVRALGRRGRVGVARGRAGDGVEQGRRVADRPRDGELRDHPGHRVARQRPLGDPLARRLEADEAAVAGRDPDRSAAVVRVRDRDHPGGDRRGGAAARAAGGVVEVPGVAGGAVRARLRGRQDAELGDVGLADRHEAGVAEPHAEEGVDRGAEVDVLEHLRAQVVRLAGQRRADVLEQERDAAERTVRQRVARRLSALVEELMDDRVELRVERLDAPDRLLDQLLGRDVAVADELGLRGRVDPGGRDTHRGASTAAQARLRPSDSASQSLQPTVSRSGRSPTRRTASSTPSMNEWRSIESWRIVSVWPSPPRITSWWATSPGRRTEWIGS